ncbi:AAA family ATPase [filamentous cyanobacterium LEGE 11480]|uniref:AAA family ATPase n=2 Tax=Romeriopsis TaxID=2992131 RepID=A0A928VI47_9CYAN|nr:AAA family ATPase [Romeriopsis navalis LEGE 11480]
MQVKRLQINAFCGIETLDLEFRSGVNILIGINGVGKSSILDCLARLVFLYTDLLLPRGLVKLANGELVKIGHEHTQNSINFQTSEGEEGTWHFRVSRDANRSSHAFFTSEAIDNAYSTSGISRETIQDFSERIKNKLIEKIKTHPDTTNIPLGVYYPTSRVIPKHPFDEQPDQEHPHRNRSNFLNIQALEGKLDFSAFFAWFKEHEDLENEIRLESDSKYRDQQLEAIRKAIPNFLPEFSHLRVKRSPLRMVITKHGEELIISQLSDGEKSLLTIIGDIARRLAICNPARENPLEGEGIILIDEIDAHLHPKWQRGIVPKLEQTFPNCQFFLATHSPQLISDVKSDHIYLLQRDEAGEVIATHPEGTYGRDTNQILEDVMGVPERPAWSKHNLQKLFQLIDSGDLAAAKKLKDNLEHRIGEDEPEFAKADVLIRRKEILGR